MYKKKVIAAFLTGFMLFSLASCNKKVEETTAATTLAETTAVESTEETTKETSEPVETTLAEEDEDLYDPSNPMALNPITGIQDMDPANVGKRLTAVSLNNYYESLPQRGLSTVDVLYEFETEAQKTRFIAFYADINTCPFIGCLRSGRYVSTDVCLSNNAVFCYWGANKYVEAYMNEKGLDRVNLNNCSSGFKRADENGMVDLGKGLFGWRDQQWKDEGRSQENTAVSNGYYLNQGIDYFEIDRNAEVPFMFKFVKHEPKELTNAQDCSEINIAITSVITDSNFKYDPATGLFMKSANGKPQIDLTTGEQVGFTNVFALYCNIGQRANQPDLRDAHFGDGGYGYYCSNGKIVKITFTQDGINSQFKYFDENGNELEVNTGKTYIAIVDDDFADLTTVYNGNGEAIDFPAK